MLLVLHLATHRLPLLLLIAVPHPELRCAVHSQLM